MFKKAICFIVSSLLLLGLAGCQSEQDKKYDEITAGSPTASAEPSSTVEPLEEGQGKLVIKSFTHTQRTPEIELLAQEFMKLHPEAEVKVEFEKPYPYGNDLTREDVQADKAAYYTRLRAELASGEADYLLYGAAGGLDYYALAPNGVLRDMAGYLEDDPDISQDSLFMPMLHAFEIDGKLPVMPYAVALQGVYLRRDILSELDTDPASLTTVNADTILGWYEQARALHPELNLFFASTAKDGLFATEMPRYIDLDAGTAAFDLPAFAGFLERTRNVQQEEPELHTEEELNIGNGHTFEAALRYQATGEIPDTVTVYESQMQISAPKNVVTKARPAFCAMAQGSVYDFLTIAQSEAFSCLTGALPLTTTDGRLGLDVIGSANFAMPSSLKNDGLAWEFVKFCLQGREAIDFDHLGLENSPYYCSSGIPVNKKNFVMLMEAAAEDIKRDSGPCVEMFNFQPVDGEAAIAAIEKVLEQHPVALSKYTIDLQDYLDEFYISGLTTPGQAAGKIQGRAYIWLNE